MALAVMVLLLTSTCIDRTPPETGCVPDCEGKDCGDDGCGGSCGTCTGGFVLIEAGGFWMGSPDGNCPGEYPAQSCIDEAGRRSDETLHYVNLTHDFEMQVTEVTQGEWKAAFGNWNPSDFPQCGDNCPVERVSWYDSLAYANWKSQQALLTPCYVFSAVHCEQGGDPMDGSDYEFCLADAHGGIYSATVSLAEDASTPYDCEGYRLPTEAEWEFAARALSLTAFYTSDGNDGSIIYPYCEPLDPNLDQIGWHCGNSGSTEPVGGKEANASELKDMLGNVWEWCWDKYCADNTGYGDDPHASSCGSSYRVVRGGSWYTYARSCRSAIRFSNSPGARVGNLGCRLARSL